MSNDIVPHINVIIAMIEKTRENTLTSVNTELIKLYMRHTKIMKMCHHW